MPSERVQRKIDQLLNEAELGIDERNWVAVRDAADAVLALDHANQDALTYLEAARHVDPQGVRPGASASVSPPSPMQSPADLPASFAAGRYRVKRFLGEGGKKRVYLAHDTLLDRDVAFALIKTEGLDDAGRERISREAQAMGKLGTHPHIVTVFDLGTEATGDKRQGTGERGQPYIVTELMTGGDVEGLIAQAPDHRPPLERSLGIGIAVCKGLEFAHGKGIVHRDLKPGNVWLTADGVAKIGDFGLAVSLDRSRLTQAGMMVGTVSYMPPEQAMGGEVTPQSDLYSLGAMLYELVTGRPPFLGDESVAIITQHLNTAPVSPSWHSPSVPPGLEALILRLLEKDPAKRPHSATEVLEALSAIERSALSPSPLEGEGRVRGEAQADASAQAALDNPMYRRTFVGREAELGQLQSAFDAATSGQGSLVMVVGEPGIGKTSLCEQLATYATIRAGKTLVGHCYEEGSLSLPYLPFVEAMRSYVLAGEPERLREEMGTGAGDIARIVSEVRDRIADPGSVGARFIAPAPQSIADPEEERYRLYQAVTGFLRNAAAVQPLVIVLEDLHDADRGTLDLLLHLSRNLAGSRLLIVGTYRDIEVDRSHPLSATLAELGRSASFRRVLLRGLTADEVQRMLSGISGQDVRWELAEAVHRQTEGNPLFVQEVLRYLVEEGLITREGGRWRASGDTPLAVSIPEGLRDVIGKRLSRLSPDCNRLLAIAAVIGRDFRLDTLQAVAGVAEEPLLAALEEATRAAVLSEQARVGGVQYRFAHAFFRQTLYEELSVPRRLRMHQEVARVLERQYGNRLEEHAAELAEHFAQSTDADDLRKAIAYAERAAGRALAVYAYGEAARHIEQALDVQEVLDPDEKAKRCDLLLALGEALLPAGEPARVFETVALQALALAEALEDSGRASRTCQIALDGLLRYGRVAMMGTVVARQWAERADRYAAAGTIARVRADLALAGVCQGDGRLAEVLSLREGALALARQLEDPETLFGAACAFISCMWQLPVRQLNVESILRVTDELSRYSREGVRATTLGAVLHFSGYVWLNAGDRTRAEAAWREAAELAQRTQDAEPLLFSLATEIDEALLDGELEAAVVAATRVGIRGDELGAPVTGRLFALRGFRPLLHLSRAKEALEALPDAIQPAGVAAARGFAAWFQRALSALVLAYLGRSDEARAAMKQLLAELSVASEEHVMATAAGVWLLETAVVLKDQEAAALLASRLRNVASLAYGGLAFTCVARHLGAAAALLGEREEALACYEQALEVARKIRFRPEIALTHLGIAELLLDGDADAMNHTPTRTGHPRGPGDGRAGETPAPPEAQRAEALAHLDFAIAEFRDMKMQPSLERALRRKDVLKA